MTTTSNDWPELLPWLLGLLFDYHIIIKFNEDFGDPLARNWDKIEFQIRERLRQFDAMIDNFLIGKNWASTPSGGRTLFVAFIERDRAKFGCYHVHLLLRWPTAAKLSIDTPWRENLSEKFTKLCRYTKDRPDGVAQQRGVCPRGEVVFVRTATAPERERRASYVIEEYRSGSGPGMIISTDFHPKLKHQ
jgi:hypothetical protein